GSQIWDCRSDEMAFADLPLSLLSLLDRHLVAFDLRVRLQHPQYSGLIAVGQIVGLVEGQVAGIGGVGGKVLGIEDAGDGAGGDNVFGTNPAAAVEVGVAEQLSPPARMTPERRGLQEQAA